MKWNPSGESEDTEREPHTRQDVVNIDWKPDSH